MQKTAAAAMAAVKEVVAMDRSGRLKPSLLSLPL
jgi:hypothetical protein